MDPKEIQIVTDLATKIVSLSDRLELATTQRDKLNVEIQAMEGDLNAAQAELRSHFVKYQEPPAPEPENIPESFYQITPDQVHFGYTLGNKFPLRGTLPFQISNYIGRIGHPVRAIEIKKQFKDYTGVSRCLTDMVRAGSIVRTSPGRYALPWMVSPGTPAIDPDNAPNPVQVTKIARVLEYIKAADHPVCRKELNDNVAPGAEHCLFELIRQQKVSRLPTKRYVPKIQSMGQEPPYNPELTMRVFTFIREAKSPVSIGDVQRSLGETPDLIGFTIARLVHSNRISLTDGKYAPFKKKPPVQKSRVLKLLDKLGGPATPEQIANILKIRADSCMSALGELVYQGKAKRVRPGVFETIQPKKGRKK